MSHDKGFVTTALQTLKTTALEAAARYKPIWHMLVLPRNETIHIPVFGCHPIGSGPRQEPTTTWFGASQVATELPPAQCWPAELAPFKAVVAEQEFWPYRPHAIDPYRVHLYFGDGGGFQDFEVLCRDLVDLADDIGRAVFGKAGDSYGSEVIYSAGDCIHDGTAAILDRWLCTVHWWAWKTVDSPIHTKPKVIFSGRAIEAHFTDKAVVEKVSISMIPQNLFAFSAATIDTFERFLEVAPERGRASTYPPATKTPESVETEEEPTTGGPRRTNGDGETATERPTSSGMTMTAKYPATVVGNVQFLEWVFNEVREQADALRANKYPYSSIDRQFREGVKWAEARERVALLNGLPETAVKQAASILRRELNAGTVEQITELLEPAVRALRNALENDGSGRPESLQEAMWPEPVDLSVTKGFRDQLHDNLLADLLRQLENKALGNPRLSILQSLQDHGCDLLAEWPDAKYGVQLKNNGDVEGEDFATKTIAQIQDSRQHGLVCLFLVLAADITGTSNQQ